MEIDPKDLAPREAYQLLTACVIPRPIAWASTVDGTGVVNLAPFSFFGGVTSHPPTVMVSVGRRAGRPKDTGANLLATGEAVVHIPTRALAAAMVATSADVEPHVDEFALAGLTPVPSVRVRPPRVAEATVALECVRRHHQEVGAGPVDLFLLEVVYVHLRDEDVVDGLPDAGRMAAVGRLGGTLYCDTAAPFAVPRP
jgi:flavin reductase (DIM6/NTAB) family NADH-FMN oxidoreductase RutF